MLNIRNIFFTTNFLIVCLIYSETPNYYIITQTFTNNTILKRSDNLNIFVENIKGKGIIEAPSIKIVCKYFDFDGIIKCDGECVIYTNKDKVSFKREGSGEFNIVKIKYYTESDILADAKDMLIPKDFTDIPEQQIDKYIDYIRVNASINQIDDLKILECVLKEIEKLISYHNNKVDQALNRSKSFKRFIPAGISFIGVGISTIGIISIFLNNMRDGAIIIDKYKISALGAFAFIGAFSISYAKEELENLRSSNINHEEKIEKLLEIRSKLTKSISAERKIYPKIRL